MQKKRPPLKQLKEAAAEAERIMIKRGIHTPESSIDRILKENKVVLPGIPAYLPHRWTLQESRRYMRDIVRLWIEKNKGNQKKQENTSAFFSFFVQQLTDIEKGVQAKVDGMPAILKSMKNVNLPIYKVFSAWRILEVTQAITRFMVDSFAVSMVVKEHHTTTQFVEWFMKWSMDLEGYWKAHDKKDD